MSKLSDPKGCKNHQPVYIDESHTKSGSSKEYDLAAIHKKYNADKKVILVQDKEGALILGFNLIEDRLHQSFYGRPSESGDIVYQNNHLLNDPLFTDILGYSFKDKSLAMTIADAHGTTQTIVIRYAMDKDGNQIKWKTYGSKRYVPYKILEDEDFVFLYSGMAEMLLMELFGFSYIGLQSDSMVRHLPVELKDITVNKVIVVLQDNDDSFRKIVPTIEEFFSLSHKVITIDFEKLLDRKLEKGYDFRDFCNQIGNADEIKTKIKEEIVNEFRS
jgi:hypothetical protein